MSEVIICHDCGAQVPTPDPPFSSLGYGYYRFDGGQPVPVCYTCCAARDKEDMIATGKATLYLTLAVKPLPPRYHEHFTYFSKERGMCRRDEKGSYGTVTNWPGTLTFDLTYAKAGLHHRAETRYDVWFKGPDGSRWHGVQYGENTQICHCRRLKG